MHNSDLFITGLWYLAFPSRLLRSGQMLHKKILGQSILFARSKAAEVFALRNICPHRGIPLSDGQFDGCEVECCYHGWRFNSEGICTEIPSLVPEQKFNVAKIKVAKFPCREIQGNIWIYMPKPYEQAPEDLPAIPELPDIGNQAAKLVETKIFSCDIDHAVIGLMDPAHGPFIHRSWFWRSKKSIHAKSKKFAPIPLGFKMLRHRPSKNSKAYALLGGDISTEISFQLPGIRIEHIKAGRYTICALTTLTPIDASHTEIHQFFYWTLPRWFNLLIPLFRPFIKAFLNQDYQVIMQQQTGLEENPKLLLIKDADTQAKWYQQLKKAYMIAQRDKQTMQNPIPETTLHWRS